jgi:hypothetical protein
LALRRKILAAARWVMWNRAYTLVAALELMSELGCDRIRPVSQ